MGSYAQSKQNKFNKELAIAEERIANLTKDFPEWKGVVTDLRVRTKNEIEVSNFITRQLMAGKTAEQTLEEMYAKTN